MLVELRRSSHTLKGFIHVRSRTTVPQSAFDNSKDPRRGLDADLGWTSTARNFVVEESATSSCVLRNHNFQAALGWLKNGVADTKKLSGLEGASSLLKLTTCVKPTSKCSKGVQDSTPRSLVSSRFSYPLLVLFAK
ncbi:hypothetical protein VNO77_33860 [Canavalia gladiata]|uniref:Uncharacterized protein n=1 Tax=Canavalia gladiata TaxID=3824 RepID=A0AAN9PWR6_CANGL